MAWAEFEEKQFEQHLNLQLAARHELFYSPGPVLEAIVGFDSGMTTTHRVLWRLFGGVTLPGIMLDSSWWPTLSGRRHLFPRVKYNVFVQAKRPQYMDHNRSREWSAWRKPYFRYLLTAHQQDALSALAQKARRSALVLYACPALRTTRGLWNAVADNSLVEKTNFVSARDLQGHNRYTFVQPGTSGIAHSDPEHIRGAPLGDAVALLDRRTRPQHWRPFLESLAGHVSAAIESLPPRSPLHRAWRDVTELYSRVTESARHLGLVAAFLTLTGTSWMVRPHGRLASGRER